MKEQASVRITTFGQYQLAAELTAKHGLTQDERYIEATMGLIGELGETIDIMKKHFFQGHKIDLDELSKEMGDVLWYFSYLATTAGISLGDIANTNYQKLKERYPNGYRDLESVSRREYAGGKD